MQIILDYFNKKGKKFVFQMKKKIVHLRRKYNIDKKYITFDKEMISRAVFIGLFIAFVPMPMQMMAVFLFAPFVRFNVPVAFLICWITNPLTMPMIYYAEYSVGSYILGLEVSTESFSLENIYSVLKPLYYGAFVFSITSSSIGYFLVQYFWKTKEQQRSIDV